VSLIARVDISRYKDAGATSMVDLKFLRGQIRLRTGTSNPKTALES
jgi:hypothetical protein